MDDQYARLDDERLLDREALARLHELDHLGHVHPDWEPVRVDWVEVAGLRARLLRVAGRGDGPTTVFVHGLGGSATNWLPVVVGAAARGDVVAVDLPGFGETAPTEPVAARPRNNARWLATLLHALDLGPVTLVGNSMGGLVSTLVAGTEPALVDRLVLLCPALPAHLPSARPSRVQLSGFWPMVVPVLGRRYLRRRVERLSYEERYDALIRDVTVRPGVVPAAMRGVGVATLARERELRWRGPSFREAAAGTMEVQVGSSRTAVDAAMRRVVAPTLFVRGQHDPLVLAATTTHVRRVRPDWTVVEPEHVAHVPMYEDPDWTLRTIDSFLATASLDAA